MVSDAYQVVISLGNALYPASQAIKDFNFPSSAMCLCVGKIGPGHPFHIPATRDVHPPSSRILATDESVLRVSVSGGHGVLKQFA